MTWQSCVPGILAALFASPLAIAPLRTVQKPEGVLIGTIGPNAVVMQYETYSATDVVADYYQRSVGRNIRLSGSREGNTWTLSQWPDFNASNATLKLRFTPNTITGTWTNLNTKSLSLPVRLRRVTPNDLNALKLGSLQTNVWVRANPYAALRFNAGFKLADPQTVGGKRVKWVVEPKSEVRLPRLPGDRAQVNDLLQLEHLRAADAALSCYTKKTQYDTKLEWYTDQLFSMSAKVDGLCGGDRLPFDNGNENITIDLKRARRLELSDLYRFTNLPVIRDKTSFDYSVYQSAVWATLLNLILTQNRTLPDGIDAACKNAYATNMYLRKLAWYLTPTSLAVFSKLRYVSCNFTLPYARLRMYLAPNSPLR